tara:strand:+ start:485 stop:1570 length:1086 start_codon:yes stop_codon:yes gene_type:complete
VDGNQSIVGNSPETQKIRALINSFAPSNASVMITGESGCGKELYAREIHDQSPRANQPFVAINCGAIPAELLESQLFGHKKGSFTGAVADYKGKFQEAHKGSIFLDEIGDMPTDMQVKLLRVLQERNITPIGSNQLIDIDVRVISATHRDLQVEMEEKRFREDLYFRLNILPVHLPSLRERASEIPDLARHFATMFAPPMKVPITLSTSLLQLFKSFDWPGNIRELSNTVQRLSVLYAGQRLDLDGIDASMLPSGMVNSVGDDGSQKDTEQQHDLISKSTDDRLEPSNVDAETEELILLAQGLDLTPDERPSLKASLSSLEQNLIKKALDEADGNVSRCAKLLKIQRTTLIERIKKYELGF